MSKENYYTVKEAALEIGVSIATVYTYINTLEFNCPKINGKKCLLKKDIEAIKRHKTRTGGTQITMLKNKTVSKNSTTGIRGITFIKKTGKYRALIQVKKKVIWLGEFAKIRDAKKARRQAEEEYFAPVIEKWEKKISDNDIVGETFNKLYVEGKTSRRNKSGNLLYKCRCECGKIKYAEKYHIVNGLVKSCGCIERRKDITGQVFGFLMAVKMLDGRTPDKKKGAMWEWECLLCGKHIKRSLNEVCHTHRNSCGCAKKIYYASLGKFPGIHNVKGTCVERIVSKNLNKNNKSGVKGVVWNKAKQKWQATIMFRGVTYNLGRYDDINQAAKIRRSAEKKLHGPFLAWYHKTFKDSRVKK